MNEDYESKYFSTKSDLFDKLYRFYSYIVAISVIIYVVLVNIFAARQHSSFFYTVSILYALYNLIIGSIILSKNENSPWYNSPLFQHFKFILHFAFCSILLFAGHGAHIFYMLYFLWLLSYNNYFTHWNYKMNKSIILGIGIASVYVIVYFSQIEPTFVHIISMLVKAATLIFISPFSYLFWKNRRESVQNYSKLATTKLEMVGSLMDIVESIIVPKKSAYTSEDALDDIADRTINIFNSDYVHIHLIEQIPLEPKPSEYKVYLSIEKCKTTDEEKQNKEKEYDQVTINKIIKNDKNIFAEDALKNNLLNKHLNSINGEGFLKQNNIKSVAAILLKNEDHINGIMFLNFIEKRLFTDTDKLTIEKMSHFVSLAIKSINEKDLLIDKIFSSMTKLKNIERDINESLEDWGKKITGKLLEESQEILKEKFAYFASIKPNSNLLTFENVAEKYTSLINTTIDTKGKGLSMESFRAKRPKIMYSKISDKRGWESLSSVDENVKSAMAIPLFIHNQARGVLFFESEEENRFSRLSAGLVKLLVDQVAFQISQEEMQYERKENKILSDFVALITEQIKQDNQNGKLLDDILGFLQTNLNAKDCDIYLKHERTLERRVTTRDTLQPSETQEAIKHIEELLEAEKILNVNQLDEREGSFLVLALEIPSAGVQGALYAESYDENNFSFKEQAKVSAIQPYLAIAILNAELIDKLKLKSRELKGANESLNVEKHEVQHRMKNFLTVLIYFMKSEIKHLQKSEIKNLQAINVLEKSISRTWLIRKLHDMLRHGGKAKIINSKFFISLVDMIEHVHDQNNIKFSKKIDLVELNDRTAYLVGMIINELIANSIKYAFPNDIGGNIEIHFKDTNDYYLVVVKDDGVGIQQYNFEEIAENTGMGIIRAMLAELKAEHEFIKSNGTIIKIKIHK